MNNQPGDGVISSFITKEGNEYLKIQHRFYYYVEVQSGNIISSVQDIKGQYQKLKEHYELNKLIFKFQKIYCPQDPKIISEMTEIQDEIEGVGWWSKKSKLNEVTSKGR